MKISKGAKQFLNYAKKECDKNGIDLVVYDGKEIPNLRCLGFFSEYEMQLGVAMGVPENNWVSTLAHELCHTKQFLENTKVWRNIKIGNYDKGEMFDMWIEKKVELTEIQRKKYVKAIIDLEYDCEKRTVQLIKRLKLPVDTKAYIRGAVSYLWSYKVMSEVRKEPKVFTYEIPQLLKQMPTQFPKNPHILTKKTFDILKQYMY